MQMNSNRRSYSELIQIPSFEDRYNYLKCFGSVGFETFGNERYLNQILYSSREWKQIRKAIIARDNGFDLAHPDYPIGDRNIYVHHINPITVQDILERNQCVFDLENLVSTSFVTHNAIHYGVENGSPRSELIIRTPNDTCPWK